MAFIVIGVGYVGHNIGKVSQRIENVNHSTKIVDMNINNVNVVSENSKKIRLECKIIKCFERLRY